MIQTSDADIDPNTQLIFTWRVFARMSATSTTSVVASTNARR